MKIIASVTILIVCAIIPPAYADLSNGLVAWYKLDESSGDALDSSGRNNTGTANGTTVVSNCKKGSCRQFNGTSDYITNGSSTAMDNLFANGVSISAWVYYPNFTSWQRTVTISTSNNSGYDVWLQANQTSGVVQFGSGTSGYKNSTSSLSSYVWYHLVGVTDYTGAGTKIYINGVDDGGSLSGTPSYSTDKGVLYIARLSGGGSSYGSGTIDDVRVYNRVLTASEVRDLYGSGAILRNGILGSGKFNQ